MPELGFFELEHSLGSCNIKFGSATTSNRKPELGEKMMKMKEAQDACRSRKRTRKWMSSSAILFTVLKKSASKATTKCNNSVISDEQALQIEAKKRRFAETILRAEKKMAECKKGSSKKTMEHWKRVDNDYRRRRHYDSVIAKQRERARMILLQMERSVDIDQNQESQRELERLCGWTYEIVNLGVALKRLGLFLKPDYAPGIGEDEKIDKEDLLLNEELEDGEIFQDN